MTTVTQSPATPGSAAGSGTVAWTEAALLDRLRARHEKARAGNGPEWVYMQHVRDIAGAWCNRTIDALAMHLWPSRGHEVHAYEVKISRSDFRRELVDNCGKSAPWTAWVDYFWIVAPKDVVPIDELPKQWGLLVPSGDGLRVASRPVRLTAKPHGFVACPDMPRGLIASMLRAAARNGSAA